MKRFLLFTVCFLFVTCLSKAQLLFYQDTYKGGSTSDGRTYASFDYMQADTIKFQLHIPVGSVIRKSFLITHRGFTFSYMKDNSLQVNFNNNNIKFDSSDIVTNLFHCDYSATSANNWLLAKDVTTLTQQTNNELIIPNQVVLMTNDTSRHIVYN